MFIICPFHILFLSLSSTISVFLLNTMSQCVFNHFFQGWARAKQGNGERKSRWGRGEVAEALALIQGGCWGFQHSSLGLGWHKFGSWVGIMCMFLCWSLNCGGLSSCSKYHWPSDKGWSCGWGGFFSPNFRDVIRGKSWTNQVPSAPLYCKHSGWVIVINYAQTLHRSLPGSLSPSSVSQSVFQLPHTLFFSALHLLPFGLTFIMLMELQWISQSRTFFWKAKIGQGAFYWLH